MRFALLFIVLLAGCTQSEAPILSQNLVVAWVTDGDLFVLRDEPVQIAGDGVNRVQIAPDGVWLAFTRDQDATLWVTDGNSETQITAAQPVIRQFAWQDDNTLLFNTSAAGNLGLTPREDLYRYDVAAQTTEPLTPGGDFSISPDGTQIIVVQAGIYGESDGAIYWDGEISNFPAVASGSHGGFYPAVQWADPSTAYVALPGPDAVYEPNAPVSLLRLEPGTAGPIGELETSFFGLPRWGNTDVLYRRRDLNQFSLYLFDGTESVQYAENVALPPRWLADGERFVFVQDGAYWLGQAGQAPVELAAPDDSTTLVVPIVAGDGIIYPDRHEGTYRIRYAAPTTNDEIAVAGTTLPYIDAILLESNDDDE